VALAGERAVWVGVRKWMHGLLPGDGMKADAMRIKYLSLAVLDLAEIRTYISTNNPDAAACG